MSKNKKKKSTNKKHTPRRTYTNIKYNQNVPDRNEYTPFDTKKKITLWSVVRYIGIWIILIATVVGMSAWIVAAFR